MAILNSLPQQAQQASNQSNQPKNACQQEFPGVCDRNIIIYVVFDGGGRQSKSLMFKWDTLNKFNKYILTTNKFYHISSFKS